MGGGVGRGVNGMTTEYRRQEDDCAMTAGQKEKLLPAVQRAGRLG